MSASLTITRGDDEIVNLVVRDPNGVGAVADDPTTWPLVNLTGYSLWFYVKASSSDEDVAALIAKTTPTAIVINADQSLHKGEASLALVPADTASIGKTYLDRGVHYEVQLKDGAGKISTVARGRIVIQSDFVRTTT